MAEKVTLKVPKSRGELQREKMRPIARIVYEKLKGAVAPMSASMLAADTGLSVSDVYVSVEWMRGQGVKVVYSALGFRLGE